LFASLNALFKYYDVYYPTVKQLLNTYELAS